MPTVNRWAHIAKKEMSQLKSRIWIDEVPPIHRHKNNKLHKAINKMSDNNAM